MNTNKEAHAKKYIEDMIFNQRAIPSLSDFTRETGITERELKSIANMDVIIKSLDRFNDKEASKLFAKIDQEAKTTRNIELLKYLIAQIELAAGVDNL